MIRAAALLFAAALALAGCTSFAPDEPLETGVFYDNYVQSPDEAYAFASGYCARFSRVAVYKAAGLIDQRPGAAFRCLIAPKCAPGEIAVEVNPAMEPGQRRDAIAAASAPDNWEYAVTCKRTEGLFALSPFRI